MKMLKRLAFGVLAAITALSVCACEPPEGVDWTGDDVEVFVGVDDIGDTSGWTVRQRPAYTAGSKLNISFFNGGYKREWIDTIAAKFEEKYPNVDVILTENNEIASTISSLLDSAVTDDIYISHNIPWETLAGQNKIAQLDDLYDSVVYTDSKKSNAPVKYKDRIASASLRTAKLGDHYWKVPYVSGAGGIAYNAKMFSENNWSVPKTYDELVALCAKIYAAGKMPFIWSGPNEYLWDCVVFDWWAQLAGVAATEENPNSVIGFNQYSTYKQFDPETSPELKKAWKAWYDLIALHPEYVVADSTGLSHMSSQTSFAQGNVAMIPAACWLESEIGEDYLYQQHNADIRLMPTPFISGAKTDAEGNPIRVNYALEAADSLVVSNKAANKEIAYEFLRFMTELDVSLVFPQKAGGALFAYKYDYDVLAAQANTEWKKSMYEILQNSIRFNSWSSNPMYTAGYVKPYVGGYGYIGAANSPSGFTPDSYFNTAFTTAKNNWTRWKRDSGLA